MQSLLSSGDEVMDSEGEDDVRSSREAFLIIVLNFVRRLNHEELADALQKSKMIFYSLIVPNC